MVACSSGVSTPTSYDPKPAASPLEPTPTVATETSPIRCSGPLLVGEGGAPEGGGSHEGGGGGGEAGTPDASPVCPFPVLPASSSCLVNGGNPLAGHNEKENILFLYDLNLREYWMCEGQGGLACQANCDASLHSCLGSCAFKYDYTCDGSCSDTGSGSCAPGRKHGCDATCPPAVKHKLEKCQDECATAETTCLKACGLPCD